MRHQVREQAAPDRSAALWCAVPVLASAFGALGWVQAGRLRAAGSASDPVLDVAVLASAACLAVAGWWLGGLLMLALAATARRLHWSGLERWASRLTPGVVARTAAAVVGIQLAVVAPAHAEDAALDPFWGTAATGTAQLDGPTGGADATGSGAGNGDTADQSAAGSAAAAAPGVTATSSPEPAVVPAPAENGSRDGAGALYVQTPSGTDAPSAPAATAPQPSVTEPAASAPNPPARERVADGVLTVMAGDTLWDLTAQLMGPDASDCAVSQHLTQWLEHNALAEHGDLIHPGDQLRVPPELLDPQTAHG